MRMIMMGTGPFAVPTFEALLDSTHEVLALVTRPTPPARGRRQSPVNPMRDVGKARGITILEPASINDKAVQEQLRQFQPELFVVCDYGQILKAATLAVAPLGGINLHGSLLPKYRGAAPINWALYHGERETGVTVIHMTPALDGGPCLLTRKTPIDKNDDAVTVERRLSRLGVEPVLEAIDLLSTWDRQSPIGQLQDQERASKAPRLKKEDGAVNWKRRAVDICNQVRAFKPWPGTYTLLPQTKGEPLRLILEQVSATTGETPSAPGTVTHVDKASLHVATGDGLLSLDRVQPAGKRPMDISEFLRGHTVASGHRFQ